MPQLDGLRAFAVIGVQMFHWAPPLLVCGAIGVPLFFQLSGFLITGILLDQKSEHVPLGSKLKHFYWRRTLRIFPLYYLVLAVGFLLGLDGIRGSIGWHAAYATNAHIVSTGGFCGAASHFWSLGVEEYFYLVWPLLILCVPRARLASLCMCSMMLAWVFRLWCFGYGYDLAARTLLFGNLDWLAAGGLLALLHSGDYRGCLRHLLDWRVTLASALLMVCGLPWWITHLAMQVAFFGIVHHAATGIPRWAGGAILEWSPIRYIGRISYGLYVWHLPVAYALWDSHELGWGWFCIKVIATLAVAIPSYHFFEMPINNLKDRVWSGRRATVVAEGVACG